MHPACMPAARRGVRALQVDGEHSEAMDHDEPEMIPEKDKDMEAPSIPID